MSAVANDVTIQPLPQYRSHKIVGAAKIAEIWDGDKLDLYPHGMVKVGADWIREKRAEKGGYYVAYEDGYTSYSPAKAFEEGYRPVVAPANAYAAVYGSIAALTPAQALLEARNLMSHPGMMFNEGTARRVIDGLIRAIDSSSCFAKAIANGQEVFVLKENDRAAPGAILEWMDEAAAHGCRQEKLKSAHEKAMRWETLPNRKWPD